MPNAKTTAADEFWEGIWWVPDGTGKVRNATPGECAAEIQRLSQTLWWLLVQSDGEVKIPLHTKTASAPVGRIEWHDEDPSGTTVVSIAP